MKLRKNANMNTVIERLKELQNHSASLITDFQRAIQLLDDTKLGISELNYNIDEEWMRLQHTFSKIESIIKGL